MAVERDTDSQETTNREAYGLWTGIFVLLTIASIPLGFGYMFGAGAGWLAFAVVSFSAAISFKKLSKEAKE